jgi:dTDP-4-amino-4,6-dideoxygalactose transaminase
MSPVWHLFVIRHPDRDNLQKKLQAAGVGTLIHYPIPPHASEAYAACGYSDAFLPLATRLAREVISLPMGPHLSLDQARQVAGIVRGVVS